jgi:hypothetical protein
LKNLAGVLSAVFLDPALVQRAKRHLIELGQKQHMGVAQKPTAVTLGVDQGFELLAG